MTLTNMMPYIYCWVVLFAVVVGLAVRRTMVARHDDETLRLGDKEAALLSQQVIIGRKIRRIDFWGEWFTVMVVLYGLVLFALYLYGLWVTGSKPVL
jgi:hypothetical protein